MTEYLISFHIEKRPCLNVAEQELFDFCNATHRPIPSCLWTDEYRKKAIERTLELDGWCRILKSRLSPAQIRLLRSSIAMNTGLPDNYFEEYQA